MVTVAAVPIADLRPDPNNPRLIDDGELASLVRSIGEFGFVEPVVARRADRLVIGGHQRLVAARQLGLTTVPVIFVDLSVELAHVLGLALNRISGSWDEARLAEVLARLEAVPDVDLSLSGFESDEIDTLLRKLEDRERLGDPEAFDLDGALDEARAEPR